MALALGKERSVLRAQQGAGDGLRTRASKKGLPPNYHSAYGMRWEHDQLVPNDDYAAACEIWQMGLEGKTLWSIAKSLTQRGLPTPKGRRVWGSTTIGGILSNRAYAGGGGPQDPSGGSQEAAGRNLRQQQHEVEAQRGPGAFGGSGYPGCRIGRGIRMGAGETPLQQRFAAKNTRLRDYLLKGRIRCALCGRVYTGVTRNGRSFYYCRGRAKQHWGVERCPAKSFSASVLEKAVYDTVANVLQDPEAYLTAIGLQRHLTEQTIRSLKDELAGLDIKFREEQAAESQALRLASRFQISEDVFIEEVGLIRTRRTWIDNEKERLNGLLDDLQDIGPDPEPMAMLRDRLGENLSRCDFQDQTLVLDAVGAKVIASGDGSWSWNYPKNRLPKCWTSRL
ncbi:MAG: recombinase zinc beta ribbon domain-containing protein [Chloroflexi bacterium]|nr:recombinase zinc beta ribbon domain-containing protein [Chloroflexota bacterium]